MIVIVVIMITAIMIIAMTKVMILVKHLWSTAVPSRPSTMRELARPCLDDNINGDDDDEMTIIMMIMTMMMIVIMMMQVKKTTSPAP